MSKKIINEPLSPDIVDVLQSKVNQLTETMYEDDQCKPIFKIFLLDKSLIMTCEHMQSALADTLFPREDMDYGLPPLYLVMESLYARTM